MNNPFLEAIRRGTRTFDLAQTLHPKLPCPASHPGFRFALMRRHGDGVRADGVSSANELMMMGGHTGTHIDSLAHVACNGLLFGGVEAAKVQSASGFSALGMESVDPIVARGVLLDVCALHGVTRLANAHVITAEELAAAQTRANVDIRPGDVVLIRTGWAQLWGDSVAFVAEGMGLPGPNEDGARWLADKGIRLTGSDTMAYEHFAAVRADALPVHRLLIVERGIHIVENLNLEELAAARCVEFAFVLAPLKIVGATGSPVRPLAITSV